MSELRKKQIIRWIGPDGKRCKPGTPGATKHVEESRKWYGTVDGKPVALSADKSTAAKMLRRLQSKADEASVGLIDPCEPHKNRKLADHLEDFKGALEAKGDTPFHVGLVIARVRALIDGIEAVYPADLDVSRASQWLHALRADQPSKELKAGKQEWTRGEVAELLGISGTAVHQAINRHALEATGNGKARRFPRARWKRCLTVPDRERAHRPSTITSVPSVPSADGWSRRSVWLPIPWRALSC